MTGPVPFHAVHKVDSGLAEVHVQTGPAEELIVTIRSDLVGTDTGDEIIRRAVARHAERRSIVRTEG